MTATAASLQDWRHESSIEILHFSDAHSFGRSYREGDETCVGNESGVQPQGRHVSHLRSNRNRGCSSGHGAISGQASVHSQISSGVGACLRTLGVHVQARSWTNNSTFVDRSVDHLER